MWRSRFVLWFVLVYDLQLFSDICVNGMRSVPWMHGAAVYADRLLCMFYCPAAELVRLGVRQNWLSERSILLFVLYKLTALVAYSFVIAVCAVMVHTLAQRHRGHVERGE